MTAEKVQKYGFALQRVQPNVNLDSLCNGCRSPHKTEKKKIKKAILNSMAKNKDTRQTQRHTLTHKRTTSA